MFARLGRYAKAYVAVLITSLTSAQVALDHGPVSQTQWITLGVGTVISLLGVFAVPNVPVVSSEVDAPAVPPAV